MQSVPTSFSTPEQLDSASLYQRFLALFPQRYGSIFRTTGGRSWRSMSQYHYLTDDQISECLLVGAKTVRAVVPDKKASYFVLSYPVDGESPNYQPVIAAMAKLKAIGLKPLAYLQPDSAGIQLFLAFDTSVNVDDICKKFANLLGPELTLHNTANPFVLPLQSGFSWLNQDFTVKLSCDDISPESAIAMFLHDMESAISSPDLLTQNPELSVEQMLAADDFNVDDEIRQDLSDHETFDSTEFSIEISGHNFSEEMKPAENLPVTFCEHLNTAEIEKVASPKVGSIPFMGGEQLLLFSLEATALPEPMNEKTKRGRRARSNLPDSAHHTL